MIDDNAWTNPLRAGNGGGAGYAEPNITVEDGGEWLAIEFNMSEGGGGDHGVVYWDYDTTAPDGLRLQGILLPFVDQAFFSEEEALAALIPDTHLRSTTSPLVSGDVEGAAPSSPNGWEFDVNASDGTSDMFVLDNPDGAVFSTSMNVDGQTIHVNVTDGTPSDGDTFQIFNADSIVGTPTVATEGWSFRHCNGLGRLWWRASVNTCGDFDMDGDVSMLLTERFKPWVGRVLLATVAEPQLSPMAIATVTATLIRLTKLV